MRRLNYLSLVAAFFAITLFFMPVKAEAACSHSSLGPQYSEATHPHEYFCYCNTCGEKVYVGGHATKNHGTGEWGSGTCPDCGKHIYVGRTCTSVGTCICGSVISAYGHSYGSTVYYEVNHPHRNYISCSRCGNKSYTGATSTLTHGNGASGSGTCRSCGTHSYSHSSLTPTTHPHETTYRCDCGASYDIYPLQSTCSSCVANSRVASSSTPTTGILWYIDGDMGYGTVITVPVSYYVEYTNTYNHPASNSPMMDYGYPAFASFSSRVTSYCEGQAAFVPTIYYVSNRTVNYYNNSGSIISTQTMNFGANTDAVSQAGIIYTITTNPSYTIVSASCNISGSTRYITGSTTTYFS